MADLTRQRDEALAALERLQALLADAPLAEAALFDREDQLRHARWERDQARLERDGLAVEVEQLKRRQEAGE